MSSTPAWLRAIAVAAGAMLLIAVGKPAVAGLALRALGVFVVGLAAGHLVVRLLAGIEPAQLYGRRSDPRPPNELPRRISSVTEALRRAHRDETIPAEVLRGLRDAFQHRLWRNHHLSTATAGDEDAIRRRISPAAADLLWPSAATHRSVGLSTSAIPDLIDEVEQL